MGWAKENLEWCECHLQWFGIGRLEMHAVENCCALGCAKKTMVNPRDHLYEYLTLLEWQYHPIMIMIANLLWVMRIESWCLW
jgi:hypothetical protein